MIGIVISKMKCIFYFTYKSVTLSLAGGLDDKEFAYSVRLGFNPCIRKIPWRRKWQPIPLFLPEGSHGQSLAGYSP